MAQWHNDWPVRRGLTGIPPGEGQNGGSRGGRKKWPKLSRLGELLNTQKNVHFFAPPGGAPRGGPGGVLGGWPGTPQKPHINSKIVYIWPKRAKNGGPGRGLPGAPRGAPGAPPGRPRGAARAGAPRARARAPGPARGRPGEGGPGPPFWGVARDGSGGHINNGPSGED